MLTFNPPVPAKPPAVFCQHVQLLEDQEELASAHWFVGGDDGVVQLLDLTVNAVARRQGHGSRVLAAIEEQCRRYWRARRKPLRRIWIAVEQKSQVIGRAFLTDHGFHHVSTISDMLKGQDLLVYSKGMD